MSAASQAVTRLRAPSSWTMSSAGEQLPRSSGPATPGSVDQAGKSRTDDPTNQFVIVRIERDPDRFAQTFHAAASPASCWASAGSSTRSEPRSWSLTCGVAMSSQWTAECGSTTKPSPRVRRRVRRSPAFPAHRHRKRPPNGRREPWAGASPRRSRVCRDLSVAGGATLDGEVSEQSLAIGAVHETVRRRGRGLQDVCVNCSVDKSRDRCLARAEELREELNREVALEQRCRPEYVGRRLSQLGRSAAHDIPADASPGRPIVDDVLDGTAAENFGEQERMPSGQRHEPLDECPSRTTRDARE